MSMSSRREQEIVKEAKGRDPYQLRNYKLRRDNVKFYQSGARSAHRKHFAKFW